MKDMQQQVDDWVQQYKVPYWEPHEILARLMEEVGELAREINHEFGPKKKKSARSLNSIKDELGDIVFTICCMANSLEIDLDQSFNNTIEKYNKRDKNRFEKRK